MLAVADGDVDSLGSVRGNVVVGIGVVAGVGDGAGDNVEVDDAAAAGCCHVGRCCRCRCHRGCRHCCRGGCGQCRCWC